MLISTIRKGFPLKINASKIRNISIDYNQDFIKRIIQCIEYDALRRAVKDVRFCFLN